MSTEPSLPRSIPLPRLAVATTLALIATSTAGAQGAPQPNPDRDAYYGETHQHTSWSVDAWLFGNHVTGPREALEYAQGKSLKHPLGYAIQIEQPLDWMGVTDHSEYVGVTKAANTPGSAVSKMPEAQGLILKDPNDPQDVLKVFMYLVSLTSKPPIKAFMTPEVAGSIWSENVQIAQEENKPGTFTAFCSYEYTSQFNNRNLHRNIFFRDCAKVPVMPFTMLDSWHPEDLWVWMDGQRKSGNELLAISHNANLSDGWMYPTDVDSLGRPIDAAWAAARDRNERLVEIKQIKGQSETHPILSPNDEYANYEIMSFLIGLPETSGRVAGIVGSYARQALKDGLSMQDTRGYNPYKFGFVGGSDSHNTGSPYRQNNFYGGHGSNDGSIEARMSGHLFSGMDIRKENPAGLTGVWAEENTRPAIWDAMYRKETFGTSGPRIKLRFFGGWKLPPDILQSKDWVKQAYATSVAMGGDLPPDQADLPPNFVVWAVKDPTSGNLDRIQVVKGWSVNGQSFEKVYDVAWAGDRKPDKWTGQVPAVQSTVDVDKGTYTNSVGATELKVVWSDPDFDPSLHAFYYARVLEIPTPRWSTIQAAQVGVAPPDTVPATVQERAWSSPIWYTPGAAARKAAPAGMTVATLTSQGAQRLNDAELEALLVGNGAWLRNNVTGEMFHARFDEAGVGFIDYTGRRAKLPSLAGSIVTRGYQMVPMQYSIRDGKVVTMLAGTPVELTVYKRGNQYLAARSNEFGYANYEFLEKGPADLVVLPKGIEFKKDQAEYLHSKPQGM